MAVVMELKTNRRSYAVGTYGSSTLFTRLARYQLRGRALAALAEA